MEDEAFEVVFKIGQHRAGEGIDIEAAAERPVRGHWDAPLFTMERCDARSVDGSCSGLGQRHSLGLDARDGR